MCSQKNKKKMNIVCQYASALRHRDKEGSPSFLLGKNPLFYLIIQGKEGGAKYEINSRGNPGNGGCNKTE